MKNTKLSFSKINKTWFVHLFNFLVVLLSVILAFWLNDSAIKRDLQEKKKNYLKILKSSLETDKAMLQELISSNTSQADSLALFRSKLAQNEIIKFDNYSQIGQYRFFGVDKSAFELIKNSDIVQVIKNEEVFFATSAVYYTYDEDIEAIQEEYSLTYQRVIEPFFIENLNIVSRTISLDNNKKINFINRIYVLESVLRNVINGYKIAVDEIDLALKEIAIELEE